MMRVVTYNIHGWRTGDGRPNLNQVADVLRATQADIIGLNEVYYPRVVEGAEQPALAALAQRLGMHFLFGPCLRWPVQDELPADAYGNALLARQPIAAGAAHLLTPVEGKEQRGLLEGRIALPDGGAFTVYVTHLDHTDEDVRLTQLRAVRTWTVRDRNRPHLVMGDFNALSAWDLDAHDAGAHDPPPATAQRSQESRVIDQMEKAGYVDAYRLHGEPGAQTFIPSANAPLRIDYIFAAQPLAAGVRSCTVWQEPVGQEASDHRPVLAEIDLPASV